MTSPVLNEAFYSGAFLIREANGYRSRDQGTMTNGTGADLVYQGGLIVSAATPSTATAAALGSNTGNGTIGAITVSGPAVPGAYVLNMESATVYTVESPLGQEIGHGTTGSGFGAGGISFTLTAGGTAFAPGDSFTITVAAGASGLYVPYTGAEQAAAILYNLTLVPAGATKKVTLITRAAEVNIGEVQWDPSVLGAGNVASLQAAAIASLTALGIVFRQNATSAG